MSAAAGEAGGDAAVFTAASTTTAATNTAVPGIATATIPAAAAGPATAARDAFGEKTPPVTWGILLRKEDNPDHAGRMGGAWVHVTG
jgi:hypothetical protein